MEMTPIQQRAVFALAATLGHEWTMVPENAMELNIEKIAANTLAARGEDNLPGIDAPGHTAENWIAHESQTGRIKYSVSPWGEANIEICRPIGAVLNCRVKFDPAAGEFKIDGLPRSGLPYFTRHVNALRFVLSALIPDPDLPDLSAIEADARPDWDGWEVIVPAAEEAAIVEIQERLPGVKVQVGAERAVRPAGDATYTRIYNANSVVNCSCYNACRSS
jgi:hypothetical protein